MWRLGICRSASQAGGKPSIPARRSSACAHCEPDDPRVFRFFSDLARRPVSDATAWAPCSWLELQAALDRREFSHYSQKPPEFLLSPAPEVGAEWAKSLRGSKSGAWAEILMIFQWSFLNRECGSSIPAWSASAVTQLRECSHNRLKVPHFIGFSRRCPKSLVSENRQPWREFTESLQPKPQKFPFSWRRLAETGSSTTER